MSYIVPYSLNNFMMAGAPQKFPMSFIFWHFFFSSFYRRERDRFIFFLSVGRPSVTHWRVIKFIFYFLTPPPVSFRFYPYSFLVRGSFTFFFPPTTKVCRFCPTLCVCFVSASLSPRDCIPSFFFLFMFVWFNEIAHSRIFQGSLSNLGID